MRFSIASYNILADAYIRPSYYPKIEAKHLEPSIRATTLLSHIAALQTDLICLQEVEQGRFDALATHLTSTHLGAYAPKDQGKPDGCAIFYPRSWKCHSEDVFYYQDGHGDNHSSGHVAHTLLLSWQGMSIAVTNTHLKWDAKDAVNHRGLCQVRLLIAEAARIRTGSEAWVLCGDLNALPASPVLTCLHEAGLIDAQSDLTQSTCAANGMAGKLDFVLHSSSLRGEYRRGPHIDGTTLLPSADEPSDHLAVIADLSSS